MMRHDQLHASLIPILRHTLALAPLPRAGLALDLACGPGLKTPLLIEACGPGVRLLGVDIDRIAIRAATTDYRPRDRRQEADLLLSLVSRSEPSSFVVGRLSFVGVVGDAQALPLRDGCCTAAFCIAALSLFADRLAALRELHRALAPGGLALLVVGIQAWAQIIQWPADLAACLVTAYAQALAAGLAPLPATPDLGGELADLLLQAGFTAPLIRAFWLDRPPTTDHRPPENRNSELRTPNSELRTQDSPLAAELPLLPWPALRSLLAPRLPSTELARCDELAADPQIELGTLALVAQAHAA
jgi:SAM-dependent methyltransferase